MTNDSNASSKCNPNGQTTPELGSSTVSSQECGQPDFEEIKEEIDQNHAMLDKREEKKCDSCQEFQGQVARLTRDLAASDERIATSEEIIAVAEKRFEVERRRFEAERRRFEAERRLRLELEQLLALRSRTQDVCDEGPEIKRESCV